MPARMQTARPHASHVYSHVCHECGVTDNHKTTAFAGSLPVRLAKMWNGLVAVDAARFCTCPVTTTQHNQAKTQACAGVGRVRSCRRPSRPGSTKERTQHAGSAASSPTWPQPRPSHVDSSCYQPSFARLLLLSSAVTCVVDKRRLTRSLPATQSGWPGSDMPSVLVVTRVVLSTGPPSSPPSRMALRYANAPRNTTPVSHSLRVRLRLKSFSTSRMAP